MLQQTRVAAVLEHYARFLQRFPDVQALARADQNDVLAAWSGLGYYRRARNLHRAARVMAECGEFPRSADRLRELPGIGRYTAAAIASIAFGERLAVVDGNVQRVLSRLAGHKLSPAEAWRSAEKLLSARAPGNFNQAMMELGATICLPRQPQCGACPVAQWCATSRRPSGVGRRPGAARVKARATYLLNVQGGRVLLKQRSGRESLMPGMWELPQITMNGAAPALRLRHSITDTDYEIGIVRSQARPREARWVSLSELARLPLTGLARKVLRRSGVM